MMVPFNRLALSSLVILACSFGAIPVNAAKAGIAWPNGESPSLSPWKTPNIKSIYTWNPALPSQTNPLGFHGIPMLWGGSGSQISQFQSIVVPGYADTVFGFNEPEIAWQSNLSPAEAATLWLQYLQPLSAQGYKLISPATINGPQWMQQFMAACNGACHLDGLAVHVYATSVNTLISKLQSYHSAFPFLPIYLTEFACQDFAGGPQCNSAQVSAFMTGAKQWLDSTPWIAEYFWFGAMPSSSMGIVNPLNCLMKNNGAPNALGQLYIN